MRRSLADLPLRTLEWGRYETTLFNGGCASYHAGLELLKILRDAPAIKPHLILTLSGINDIDIGHSDPRWPLLNKAHFNLARDLCAQVTGLASFSSGLKHTSADWQNWLRHCSVMNAVAGALDAKFVAFLQPTMGSVKFMPNENEQEMIRTQADMCFIHGQPYLEYTREYYDNIRSHLQNHECDFIVDISQIFNGMSDVFLEYRHPNSNGHRIIAEAIFAHLKHRLIR